MSALQPQDLTQNETTGGLKAEFGLFQPLATGSFLASRSVIAAAMNHVLRQHPQKQEFVGISSWQAAF